MGSSKDIREYFDSRLPGILIEMELNSRSIEAVFNAIMTKNSLCEQSVFYRVKGNKLTVGLLPDLTAKMEKALYDSGSCCSQNQIQSIFNTYIEKRKVVIVSTFEKSVLVTKSEILALIGIKIKRKLGDGTLIKRRLDCDIFVALVTVNSVSDEVAGNRISNANEPVKDKLQQKGFSNSTNKNVTLKLSNREYTASKLSSVAPRDPHSTTLIDLEIIAFPSDGQKYNKPKYPDTNAARYNTSEDKYPTQVTEMDAGQPSFESYPRHTSVGFPDSGYTDSQQSNLSSEPNIQNGRQTADRRNVVPSGNGITFDAKPPRYPDYREQQQRVMTFITLKWPADDKPDLILLAECGFFFTGNQDLVRCYQCGIGLKDWVLEDDVLTEHVKHSSTCDFLVQKFGKSKIERMKLVLSSDKNDSASNASQLPYKIRSPRYQTMEARLASFKDFPQNIKLPPQQLAVAGLYFTGKGDLCRCFTCDGGLKDWSSGDDPVKEHATYFPHCSYIIQIKGQEYVKLQQQRLASSEPMGAAGGNGTITQPAQASPNLPIENLTIQGREYSFFDVSQVVQKLGYAEVEVITAKAELERTGNKCPTAEDIVNVLLDKQEKTERFPTTAERQENKSDLRALVQENKKLARLVYCMLCITGEADILFLPCTHHRTCQECAADLIYCPVCNEFIKEKVKTFRA